MKVVCTLTASAYIYWGGALWQTIYMVLICYTIYIRLGMLVNVCIPNTIITTITFPSSNRINNKYKWIYVYPSIFMFLWLYSCYCVAYTYPPISGHLVSNVNVHGNVIFVCLWLGSLLFPLRLQASMVLVFIMNHCCRSCRDRILLWASLSFWFIPAMQSSCLLVHVLLLLQLFHCYC